MPGLSRVIRTPWRRDESEHGAAATLVAMMLSVGVLLGMGALVIDVGRLQHEREQLQTLADAISWKLANNCSKFVTSPADPKDCTAAKQAGVVTRYTTANVKDRKADTLMCFSLSGLVNATCSFPADTVPCPPVPVPAAGTYVGKWVEVRTSTRTPTEKTLFPPSFAGVLTPNAPQYRGMKVSACARVAWGPPAVDKVFALGISKCDFDRMTASPKGFYGPVGTLLAGLGLYPLLGLAQPSTGKDGAIVQATGLGLLGVPVPACTLAQPTIPRGYQWLYDPMLNPPDANCELRLKVTDKPRGFLLGNLDLATSTNCLAKLLDYRNRGLPILVPIYDKVEEEILTLAPQYRIAGFASFVPTGWKGLLGAAVGSLLGGGTLGDVVEGLLCGLSNCIYGYFTKTLVPRPRPSFGNGDDFGATVIGRTG